MQAQITSNIIFVGYKNNFNIKSDNKTLFLNMSFKIIDDKKQNRNVGT